MNNILNVGNSYYAKLRPYGHQLNAFLAADELLEFNLFGSMVDVDADGARYRQDHAGRWFLHINCPLTNIEQGLRKLFELPLSVIKNKNPDPNPVELSSDDSPKNKFGLVTSRNKTYAVIKDGDNYLLFDSHSCDNIGLPSAYGVATLISSTNLQLITNILCLKIISDFKRDSITKPHDSNDCIHAMKTSSIQEVNCAFNLFSTQLLSENVEIQFVLLDLLATPTPESVVVQSDAQMYISVPMEIDSPVLQFKTDKNDESEVEREDEPAKVGSDYEPVQFSAPADDDNDDDPVWITNLMVPNDTPALHEEDVIDQDVSDDKKEYKLPEITLKRKTAPPLDRRSIDRAEELAFIDLFPEGKYGQNDPSRRIKMSIMEYCEMRYLGSDPRFRRREYHDYLFDTIYRIYKDRISSAVSVCAKNQTTINTQSARRCFIHSFDASQHQGIS